jgi:hypothetical protein
MLRVRNGCLSDWDDHHLGRRFFDVLRKVRCGNAPPKSSDRLLDRTQVRIERAVMGWVSGREQKTLFSDRFTVGVDTSDERTRA